MNRFTNESYEAAQRDYGGHCAIRLTLVIGATAGLLIVRSLDPVAMGKRLPFPTACGAVTGLPCVFCGMTRALHLLLNGDLRGALYFNWLVFPFLGSVVFVVLMCMIEVAKGRTILNWNRVAPIARRKLTIIWGGVVSPLDAASLPRDFAAQA